MVQLGIAAPILMLLVNNFMHLSAFYVVRFVLQISLLLIRSFMLHAAVPTACAASVDEAFDQFRCGQSTGSCRGDLVLSLPSPPTADNSVGRL